MTNRRLVFAATAAVAVAIGAAACGGGSDGGSTPATAEPAAASSQATVKTADAGDLGTVLVEAGGMTVYLFEKDENGMSSCDGACAKDWPPVTADAAPVAGDGLDAAKLGTTKRADGTTQVTYAGHPLYRFAGDSAPGDTNGEGVDAYGAEWYAVSPAGEAVEAESGSGSGMYGGGY